MEPDNEKVTEFLHGPVYNTDYYAGQWARGIRRAIGDAAHTDGANLMFKTREKSDGAKMQNPGFSSGDRVLQQDHVLQQGHVSQQQESGEPPMRPFVVKVK